MENKINLSIVVPAYNEAENLPELIRRLTATLVPLSVEYEIIIVDDGSTDDTAKVIALEQRSNSSIKGIFLSRNFGHQAALNAGLDHSVGDAVITMDADLQQPPEMVGEMYDAYKNGYDLVLAERKDSKNNSLFKKISSKFFYRFLNIINDFEIRANVADFNLYSRRVLNIIKDFPERDRFLRGLVQWVGFDKKYLTYELAQRYRGKSKYGLKKMFKLGLSGITSFSGAPLRIAWVCGLVAFVGGLFYSIYIFIFYLLDRNVFIPGWSSTIILVLIMSGVQLMILGLIGEYLYKIYNEIKGRPVYIVKMTSGFTRENQN